MKIVDIQWQDAASLGGWRSKRAARKFADDSLAPCRTVGMLYHEDEHKVVIIHTDGDNQVLGLFEIPRGCITVIKEIGSTA